MIYCNVSVSSFKGAVCNFCCWGGSLNQNMYNQRSEMERGIMGVVALQRLCQR